MPSALISGIPTGFVNAASAAPPRESGAYRTTGVSPYAAFAANLRTSRTLPWLAAGLFVVAGLVGGFLRGNPEAPATAPVAAAAAAAPPPESTVTLPVAVVPAASPAAAGSGALAPTGSAGAAGAAGAPSAPPAAPSQATILWRPVQHAPPPPPPPRQTFVTRPAPPPPAPAPNNTTQPTSAASSSKADCNPPFYYDGTKKVFKPSCL
jgi:hypothetical protein